jgi:hypothetical protein
MFASVMITFAWGRWRKLLRRRRAVLAHHTADFKET